MEVEKLFQIISIFVCVISSQLYKILAKNESDPQFMSGFCMKIQSTKALGFGLCNAKQLASLGKFLNQFIYFKSTMCSSVGCNILHSNMRPFWRIFQTWSLPLLGSWVGGESHPCGWATFLFLFFSSPAWNPSRAWTKMVIVGNG